MSIMTVIRTNNDNRINKKVVFKNNVPFQSTISKINNTFIDSAEILILLFQ